MTYLGCDPGLNGGLCAINDDGNIVCCAPMQVIKSAKGKNTFNVSAIAKWIAGIPDLCLAAVEKPIAMPGLGSPSLVSIGYGNGILCGILAALNIPYILVTAQAWQKDILQNVTQGDTKSRSIQFAQQMKPLYDWRGTEKSKKMHDGKTDAFCIAMYCKKHL